MACSPTRQYWSVGLALWWGCGSDLICLPNACPISGPGPQRACPEGHLHPTGLSEITHGQALETALGPLASDETRTAIRRAESRPQALTLQIGRASCRERV